MKPTRNNRTAFLYALAFLVLMAGVYHFIGLFYKINDAPIWRHVLFVLVDFYCVYGLLKRPKYFVYFFLIMTIQQYYSHGFQLIENWNAAHKIHWVSLFILVLFPIGLWFLYIEQKSIEGKEFNHKNGFNNV